MITAPRGISRVEAVIKQVAEIQPLVPLSLRPKKIFKLGLETLKKKGYKREDFVLVREQLPELPKGKVLNEEGLIVSAPKPPKSPKPAKPAVKKKRKPASSESSTKLDSKIQD